ncbi:MAG TPA: Rab family GTPase [Gemmatimonadaceae bacterium]|nr:Rab family GTPase [Gemmatimonadaceae bacterium]
MIQKKICMVGMFGTGKTSLVQRYVYSMFSQKYHSTVGVKVDRKEVQVDGETVKLLLWDIEGRTAEQDIPATYLKGAHGIVYVVDGTRRETLDQLESIQETARRAAGSVPSVVALNKCDLTAEWKLKDKDETALRRRALHSIQTSAKLGEGVEQVFQWVAAATVNAGLAR